MIRTCSDCAAPYSIEPEEEDWFRREGLSLPRRCARCRAVRRSVHDRYLTCGRCGRSFVYPREIQLYARSYGWGAPGRCIGGCPGEERGDETEAEQGMRKMLESLRDRRERAAAPPIELVLEAARSPRPAPRAVPSADDLFGDLGGEPEPGGAEEKLRQSLSGLSAQRTAPDQLFGSLSEGGGPARRRKNKKKRRPRR